MITVFSLLFAAYSWITTPAPLGDLTERVQQACGVSAVTEPISTQLPAGQTGLRVRCGGEQIDVLQVSDARTLVIVGDTGESLERLGDVCGAEGIYMSQNGGVSFCRDTVLSWHRDTEAGKTVLTAVRFR